jgi:hypothetical protein
MKTTTYISRILWYQGIGFLVIIAFSWIDEILTRQTYFGGSSDAINWGEGILENLVVVAVAVPVMILTKRLLFRLYYLEGFLRVCAWCKKLENNDQWIPIETFFKQKFKTESSHGICPECYEQTQQQIRKSAPQ